MGRRPQARMQLTLFLCAALAVRLFAAYWWQMQLPDEQRFGFPDSDSYWVLAQSIAHGEPYQYGGPDSRIFRMPGYPTLLAAVFLVAGDQPHVLWARGLGALLGAVTVGGVYCLAHSVFDRTAAMIAAILATFYPGAVAMAIFVLSETAFCPLILLQLILWIAASRSKQPGRRRGLALAAGVTAGVATLVRPSWLLFTPFAGALFVALGKHRARNSGVVLVMIGGLVVTMTPWWIRNFQVSHRFIATTLQVGASLYDGWNPQATGASDMNFLPAIVDQQRASDTNSPTTPAATFEYRLDKRLRDAAIAWAWENPVQVTKLAGIKLVRMWNLWPNAPEFQGSVTRWIVLATYLPLIVCAAWGAFLFCRSSWPCTLCLLPTVYLTLLHMVFVSSIRYREPAMLTVIVLAAGAISQWLRFSRVHPVQTETV